MKLPLQGDYFSGWFTHNLGTLVAMWIMRDYSLTEEKALENMVPF
jgi:hypothetical protein